jgi:hypothetical protein
LDGPVGTAWGYAASTDSTLTAYTRKTEHAAASEHPCPMKPERDTAIRIDGTPARFLQMHCPANGGILVLLGITVHHGTAFIFAFQGPPGNRAAENEEAPSSSDSWRAFGSETAPRAELLIDCEENRALRAVLVGMLRETDRPR